MPKFSPGDLVRFQNPSDAILNRYPDWDYPDWEGQLCIVVNCDETYADVRRLAGGEAAGFFVWRLHHPEETNHG